MKKRILAFLLCFALVMPILPASATETDPTETTVASSEPTVTSAPTDPAPSTDPSEPETPPTTTPVTPASDEEEEETTAPTEKETEPSNPATEPSSEPTDPSEPATEPSTEATEPSEPETEPSTEATEPSDPETEPSTEATEPSEPEMTEAEVEALYNAIMACATSAELDALLGEQTEEEFYTFAMKLTEEQRTAMTTYLEALAAASVEIGEPEANPAVNYSNAAPFGEPVVGQPVMRLMRMMSTLAAADEETTDNGLELNKSVSGTAEDGYTLTLEAWATGAKTITSSTTNVPTDIILVLDQSGSMDYCMYSDCESTSSNHTHQVTTYTEAYNVGNSGNYYYNNNGSYQRAYYCSGSDWSNCDAGWYTQEHGGWNGHGGTALTPKASADSEGTQFYTATTTRQSFDKRITALKNALTNFASSVATKAKGEDGVLGTADDVDHTISVVGFANYSNYQDYNNTEVFVGGTGYKYGTSAQSQYENAPQDMSTPTGVANVADSIDELDANGATYIDLGIELANGILNANPVPSGEKRNRVVIIFTDGVPGYSGSYSGETYGSTGGNAQAVADAAMTQIATTKNTHNATVYTVGIFAGADATSAGSNANGATDTQRANYFMQRLSSNTTYPQTPSYYLSASDSATLNNIFETISQNIESGGSTTTLTESAVVKDVITDQFELPAGSVPSSIKVYTADYIGEDTFADRVSYDATVTISEDGKTISVTNFDYSENWVGTETAADGTVTYRGKKLIIEIPIVVRDGFLGGNGVYTNDASSGLYENDESEEALENFERPTVDVQIEEVTVTAPDHNVYLLGGVSAEQLEAGLNVSVGEVTLDMDADNYGLQSWQNAYVTIGEGDGMTALNSLTEDATYSATVTVTPNTTGTATAKSNSGTGNIFVFKPYTVYQDSSIVANTIPDYETLNFVSVTWKHGETEAPETMGDAPALTYTYDPAEKVLTEETEVKASVAIGTTDITQYVSFWRNACAAENGCDFTGGEVSATDENRVNFIVHMKTCDLIISKIVNNQENAADTFVFTVTGPNGFAKTVVINGTGTVTIADLPLGEYTVTEDTNWSWRYTCNPAAGSITKTISPNSNTFEFTNTFNSDSKWLTDTSYAKNLFGSTSAVIK